MTKAFALKISMKALFFFVVFLQYNKNRGRLTDLLDSLFFFPPLCICRPQPERFPSTNRMTSNVEDFMR